MDIALSDYINEAGTEEERLPCPTKKATMSTSSRAMPPPSKRQRPIPLGAEDPLFLLTINVHNTQLGTVHVREHDSILFLKQCLVRSGVVPWPLEGVRIARRLAGAGEVGYDLPDDMWTVEAAEAWVTRGQTLKSGILDVHQRNLKEDVEMGDQ